MRRFSIVTCTVSSTPRRSPKNVQTKEGGRKDMYIIITFIHLKDTWKVIPEADPLAHAILEKN